MHLQFPMVFCLKCQPLCFSQLPKSFRIYSSSLTSSMKTFLTTLGTVTLTDCSLTTSQNHFISFYIPVVLFQISHKAQKRNQVYTVVFVTAAPSRASFMLSTLMSMGIKWHGNNGLHSENFSRVRKLVNYSWAWVLFIMANSTQSRSPFQRACVC